jgi:short-subunit dehydrogenase
MTWLITGASRGLGRHLVTTFAELGQPVLAVARDAERLHALAAAHPGRVTPLALDLADAQQLSERLPPALAALPHLSGVIHNAGIGRYAPLLEHSQAESLAILQVNIGAVVQITHAVLPRLVQQKSGHLIHIGSDLARRPLANMAVYVASKHALAGFAHSLLREVKGQGIKVSLVNPGIIDTDFGGRAEGSGEESWSLRPAQLAQLVWQVATQPGSMVVDELTVHPLGQDF